MINHWLAILGLITNISGTIFLSYGLIITKKDALELGVSRLCGDDEDNLELPQVKDRLKQSKNATVGLVFLLVSFLLQMIVIW